MKNTRKKYYRISRENGQIEFSDKYDEALGYIGLTKELTFSRRVTDKDMLKMSEGLRKPGPFRGSVVHFDGDIIPGDPRLKTYSTYQEAVDFADKMGWKGVWRILPGKAEMITGDGIALFSGTHPRPPFWKGLWERVKAIFIRPKFSAAALEPYEPTKEEREYRARVLGDFEALGIYRGPKKGERIKPCTCMSCRAYMASIGKGDYWKEI